MTGGANGKELQKDLNGGAESLSKIGVSDLRLVTQMLVKVEASATPFAVEGSIGESTVHVTGERAGTDAYPTRLSLEIEAKKKPRQPNGGGPQAAIKTFVSLSPGQFVVLGVAPSEDAQSVFVVQLVE